MIADESNYFKAKIVPCESKVKVISLFVVLKDINFNKKEIAKLNEK